MRTIRVLIALLLACTVAGPLAAQTPAATGGRVPVSRFDRLDASGGGKSYVLAGGIIGAAAGAGITALTVYSGGSTAPCDRSANQDAISSGACLGIIAAGAVVGGAIGALIGSRIRRSARQETPRTDLRVLPRSDGGTDVGVRFRF